MLKEMETAAHNLSVVTEGAGIRATYLTTVSRLLADEAGRLLRLGAPASGKNYAVEIVFAFVPADAIVQVSGSSPKSLAYYGGDDPDALKHKIIYIPEAAIIASKRGEENDFAILLRSLISEGQLNPDRRRLGQRPAGDGDDRQERADRSDYHHCAQCRP